mgnify:CR=1 FL=1
MIQLKINEIVSIYIYIYIQDFIKSLYVVLCYESKFILKEI